MDVKQGQSSKNTMKNFEIDSSLLSRFVWPLVNIFHEFFDVLSRNGGTYLEKKLKMGEVKVELKFPIAEIPLIDVLSKIFNGKIPVDCSLFMQILLYKDIKNGCPTFGVGGTLGDIIIGSFASYDNLDVGYYDVKDLTLRSLLSNSLCDSKGEWVIRTDTDKYLGMTKEGVKSLSDLEWRTHLANGINSWVSNRNYLIANSDNPLEIIMIELTISKIKLHCQDHNIMINTDQIVFNPNPFKALMAAHNIPVDEK